jgi:hypothetical protein
MGNLGIVLEGLGLSLVNAATGTVAHTGEQRPGGDPLSPGPLPWSAEEASWRTNPRKLPPIGLTLAREVPVAPVVVLIGTHPAQIGRAVDRRPFGQHRLAAGRCARDGTVPAPGTGVGPSATGTASVCGSACLRRYLAFAWGRPARPEGRGHWNDRRTRRKASVRSGTRPNRRERLL